MTRLSLQAQCAKWVETGQCESNRAYMESNCKKSCKFCGDAASGAPKPEYKKGPATVELMGLLKELEAKVKGKVAADPDSKKVRMGIGGG